MVGPNLAIKLPQRFADQFLLGVGDNLYVHYGAVGPEYQSGIKVRILHRKKFGLVIQIPRKYINEYSIIRGNRIRVVIEADHVIIAKHNSLPDTLCYHTVIDRDSDSGFIEIPDDILYGQGHKGGSEIEVFLPSRYSNKFRIEWHRYLEFIKGLYIPIRFLPKHLNKVAIVIRMEHRPDRTIMEVIPRNR